MQDFSALTCPARPVVIVITIANVIHLPSTYPTTPFLPASNSAR